MKYQITSYYAYLKIPFKWIIEAETQEKAIEEFRKTNLNPILEIIVKQEENRKRTM